MTLSRIGTPPRSRSVCAHVGCWVITIVLLFTVHSIPDAPTDDRHVPMSPAPRLRHASWDVRAAQRIRAWGEEAKAEVQQLWHKWATVAAVLLSAQLAATKRWQEEHPWRGPGC